MKKKSLFLTLLVASLMLVSTLSLSSCKKDAPVGESIELPGRAIDNACYVCQRELTPAPAGTPLPPPHVNTDYSCYHELGINEPCPFVLCNLYPRHHYHFYYVGHTHNIHEFISEHIGGKVGPL